MFLFHPDIDHLGDHARYKYGWKARIICGANELPGLVLHYMCSPSIWAKGIRLRENFLLAEWIALDFDKDCPTLEEAKQIFWPLIHVIGTTKSHQKKKGDDPPRDRYRVFLKLYDRCKDWRDFEATTRQWAKDTGADMQAINASQGFLPCKELYSVKYWGGLVDIVKHTPPVKKEVERRVHNQKKFDEKYGNKRVIPRFVKEWLTSGCRDGERNRTCFRAGGWLSRCGFNEDEIVRMIMNSPLPVSNSPAVEREVRDAVRRGISSKP